MMNDQGDRALAKQQKTLNKCESLSTNTVAEQSMSSWTLFGISYEVWLEILTEKLNMPRIATKFVSQLLTIYRSL
jgi:hypothetical protein